MKKDEYKVGSRNMLWLVINEGYFDCDLKDTLSLSICLFEIQIHGKTPNVLKVQGIGPTYIADNCTKRSNNGSPILTELSSSAFIKTPDIRRGPPQSKRLLTYMNGSTTLRGGLLGFLCEARDLLRSVVRHVLSVTVRALQNRARTYLVPMPRLSRIEAFFS